MVEVLIGIGSLLVTLGINQISHGIDIQKHGVAEVRMTEGAVGIGCLMVAMQLLQGNGTVQFYAAFEIVNQSSLGERLFGVAMQQRVGPVAPRQRLLVSSNILIPHRGIEGVQHIVLPVRTDRICLHGLLIISKCLLQTAGSLAETPQLGLAETDIRQQVCQFACRCLPSCSQLGHGGHCRSHGFLIVAPGQQQIGQIADRASIILRLSPFLAVAIDYLFIIVCRYTIPMLTDTCPPTPIAGRCLRDDLRLLQAVGKQQYTVIVPFPEGRLQQTVTIQFRLNGSHRCSIIPLSVTALLIAARRQNHRDKRYRSTIYSLHKHSVCMFAAAKVLIKDDKTSGRASIL